MMNTFDRQSEPPQVSIALATCNGERFIREQIESILNQTIKPAEIIVCDDCSADATISVLKEYGARADFKFYVNDHPLGVVRNFKKAIDLCSFSYIALSDQDDVWNANKLQLSIDKMKLIEDENLPCLVYSDLEVVDDELRTLEKSFWRYLRVHPDRENFKSILYGNVVTGCTTVINHSFKKYMEMMPADASMHDQWMGLVAYGLGKTGVVCEPTLKYRRHSENVTNVESLSYFGRAKRALNLVLDEMKNPSFLDSEINQARLFYKTYALSLNENKISDLNDFLAQSGHGYFSRKARKILAKRFYKFID